MFDEFSTFYAREIAPRVDDGQKQVKKFRKTRQSLASILSGIWLVLGGGLIAVIWTSTDEILPLIIVGFMTVFGGLIMFFAVRNSASRTFERDFAGEIANVLVERAQLGTLELHPKDGFVDYKALEGLDERLIYNAIPAYGISGAHNRVSFRLLRVCFTTRTPYGGNETSTGRPHTVYFDGPLVELDLPRAAPVIVVRSKTSFVDRAMSSRLREGLQDVDVAHSGFSNRFEVKSSQPVDARNWLTQGFLDGVMRLPGVLSLHDSRFCFVFQGRRMWVGIFFEQRETQLEGEGILDLLAPRPERSTPYKDRVKATFYELKVPSLLISELAADWPSASGS